MEMLRDRTYELEQRMKAVHIGVQDSCAFFKLREDSLANQRQCWYCVHSQFDRENNDLGQLGLCRFKR